MKKLALLPIFTGLVTVAGLCQSCWAQGHHSTPRPTTTRPAVAKDEKWIVVKIGEDYKSIRDQDLQNEQKRLTEEYKKKMKEWQDERKHDSKAEKPPKLVAKRVGPVFNTQKGADEYRETLEDKGGKGKKGPVHEH